jgi:uncharacterized repeat protein (TIGR01451 family)
MASRGIWRYMSVRTRRSLTLTWTALFVFSLLLQYLSFAAAPPVLAVHNEGVFELEGDATSGAAPGDDWDKIWNGTSGAAATVFQTDTADLRFTGGSKDTLDVDQWSWDDHSSPDKDNILHAYAGLYENGGDEITVFGLDRFANSGDANVGFWFFQSPIGINANGTFSGSHRNGDVFIVSEFDSGGDVSTIVLYKWLNGGLSQVVSGIECSGPGADDICAIANTDPEGSPWPYTPKAGAAGTFPIASFFEGGADMGAIFGTALPCFSTFLAETRSSTSTTAELKNFVIGNFNTCQPPTIATQVSNATVDFGGTVTDTATLSGNDGPASGTVTFFICTPAQVTAAGCPSGGTQVGSPVAVSTTANGGTATSSAYTVGLTAAAVGKYCFRAVYAPDQASQYLAGSHTNATTECFTVAPATIDITKVANPAGPVSAGDVIGFDIVVTNTGTGTALNVAVNDPLPPGVDWTLGTVTGGATCAITGSVGTEVLACTKASLAAAASFSVRITGATDPADCGTVSNTASVTTSNDGSDAATASVVVQCPDVTVVKTPDGGDVNAGSLATFTIVVSNIGPGIARNVTLTDNLPGGIDWSEDSTSCSITGPVGTEVLSCNFGDMASGGNATVNVSGLTDAQDCGNIPNTATVGSTNERAAQAGNNSDTGSIDVLCADIQLVKDANPVGPVSAGDPIGWDITVSNVGDGTAIDVHVTDSLPAGVDWVLGAISGDTTGVTCSITGAIGSESLVCDDPSMAPTDSFKVHVSAATDAADCGTINNTATVTTSNDGSSSDSASVVVRCPDLEVVKSGNGPLNAGDIATFTITLTNHGPGAAHDVTLTDQLPSGTWTLGGANAADCVISVSNMLSCDFGDVASGGIRTITVSKTTTADDCGTISNEVTVSASNEPDNDQFPNSDDADIVVNCPDLEVVKSGNGPLSAGQIATFTITVTNHGPGTAYDVTLSDQLPSGTWALGGANAADCAISVSNLLTCAFGDLADDATRTFTVSKTTVADDCGTIHNDVAVAASNEDTETDQFPNSDDADIVVNCPDVTVIKTGNGAISAGQLATFDIAVTNLGPGTAFGVTLSDQLPAGTWTLGGLDAADCSIDASNLLTCDFGDLANGVSRSITVSRETTAEDCGELPNTATVLASNEAEEDTDNNESSDTITVDCPLIVITKTADDPIVDAGDQIGFVVTVTNTGDGSAFNVTVTDVLPTIAGLSWSIESQSGGWSIVGGTLQFGPATLASGGSASVHIVSSTTSAACGDVPNVASVIFDGGSGSDASTVEVLCAEIGISKISDADTISAGDQIGFTVTLTNDGAGAANGLAFMDELPGGPGINWSIDPASEGWSITGPAPNQVLVYEPTSLAGETTTSVHVVSDTTAASCGIYDNTATITTVNDGSGEASDSVTLNCPDIAVEKTATNTPIPVGEDLVFDITVTNIGDGVAFDVVLTDELPAGFAWAVDSEACDIVDGTLTCDLGDMQPGATVTVTLTAPTIDQGPGSDDCGTIDNAAVANAINESEDLLENNADDASIIVVCPTPSTLTIGKSFTGNTGGQDPILDVPLAMIGDTLTFTLAYTGSGPITNAVITDVLPIGLDYVENSAEGDANFTFVDYDDATRTLTWTAATLPDPASGSVTYDVTVLEAAAEEVQPLVNVATIDSDETEPDDDTRSVAVLPPVLALTPPPTSTLTPETGTSNPGFTLMLVLLAFAGLALGVGFVTPVPERVRRRDRLG